MSKVIHDVGVWLPRTKTWLYNEIAGVGTGWEAWVVANRTQNLGEFPFPHVYSLRDQVGKSRWMLEMILRRSRLAVHAPSITRFCEGLGANLLHSHFGTVGWLNLGLARRLGIPHVVTFYGFDVTLVPRVRRWRSRYDRMFRQVTSVLCEGPHMAEEIAKLGCPPDKITVQPLGVRLADLPLRMRERGSEPIRFLMAGSFREKKGLTDGLAALGRLAKSRPELDWQLTIVGGPGSRSEGKAIAARLLEIAERDDISDRIHYTGFLSHADLIVEGQQHDVFICPSVTAANGDTEGGAPVVMIEMAAMGLPIIATQHCDLPFVLGERNRAMLAPERDVYALADALGWLVDHAGEWPDIGAGNRKRCESLFDHIVQGERLAQIYDKAVS